VEALGKDGCDVVSLQAIKRRQKKSLEEGIHSRRKTMGVQRVIQDPYAFD
jgi:hypothetical protein